METKEKTLPTIKELVAMPNSTEEKLEIFKTILNQNPLAAWVATKDGIPYLPVSKVELTLRMIYGAYRVELLKVEQMVNSVLCTVRLHVLNPITGEWEWNDGLGASPISTKAGKGAIEWAEVQATAVQKAAPSAKSYALKDAADCFGKIFGSNLGRKK